MITAWILYALLVGTLVGSAAFVLDVLLRAHRLPSRGVWAGAMALSFLWPLGTLVWRNRPRAGPEMVLPDLSPFLALEPMTIEVSPQSFLHLLDGPIMVSWGIASGALLLFFSFLVVRTHRLRKQWDGERLQGQTVLFSDLWGPAVVGFVRPQIVLPQWCREMENQALQLVLDHELEHVRAGDLRLILAAGVLPVLFPWNLPIWWQLSRLRLAVEGDCDLRVLRKHGGRARPYLNLLLDVGKRAAENQPLATMLSEPEETLERRIRIMTMPFPKKPWIRGVLLAGVGAVLVALACWAPGPTNAQDEEVAAVLADSLFSDGYIRGIDAKDWQEAIDRFNSAKELDVPEATAQKLNFWLGYALFQQARTDQEPQTLETAQTTLGTFREALRLFESSGDYARANDLEGNLMELVKGTGTFIEIQEAIIRRGR
jgi:bla regulator protein BlaR1